MTHIEEYLAKRDDWYFPLLSGLLAAFSSVQVSVLSLSLAHINITRLVAWCIIAVAVAAGYFSVRLLADSEVEDSELQVPISRTTRVIVKAFAAFTLASMLCLILVSCATRDFSYDGNTYHLTGIHFWIQRGYVYWIRGDPWHVQWMNAYPRAVEVVSYILARAFSSTNLPNTQNVLFAPLGVLGVASLARMLGAPAAFSLVAGLFWTILPVQISQAGTTYVDAAFSSCVVAFWAALLHVYAGVSGNESRVWRRQRRVLGCALGLVLGSKSSGLVVGGIGLAVLAVILAWDCWERRNTSKVAFLKHGLSVILLGGVIAFSIAGYWYVRNWVVGKNPVYPFAVTVGNHQIFPGTATRDLFERETPGALRPLPDWRRPLKSWIPLQTAPFRPFISFGVDQRVGGLGYLWITGCLPAICVIGCGLLIKRRYRLPEGRYLLMLIAVGVLSFLATPSNWWARYTTWLYGVGLCCMAFLASRVFVRENGRFRTWFVKGWLVLCTVLAVAEACNCLYRVCKYQIVTERNWASTHDTIFDRVLDGDEDVAVRSNMKPLQWGRYRIFGRLSHPIGKRHILLLPDTPGWADLAEARRMHIRYVIWNNDQLPKALEGAAVRKDKAYEFVVLTLPL